MIQCNYKKTAHDEWTVEEGLAQLEEMGVVVRPYGWGHSLDLTNLKSEMLEFGRTEEAYNQWGIKLLYAIVSFRDDSFLWGGLMTYLKKIDINNIVMTVSYSGNEIEGEKAGYIDHESDGALARIFGNGISFDGYLRRKDVYLVIDNEG
jgi:hypothetical protein